MASPPRPRRERPPRSRMGISKRLRRFAARWVMLVGRRPGRVMAAAVGLALLCGVYAATSLEISTSNRDLIDPDVPYRQNQAAFLESFPQFDDVILALVEGRTPEATDAAAERLLEALQDRSEAFASIYAPGSEPFFRRNGLLYLGLEELEALADRLARIQPLLVRLAQDPGLPTLFALLADAVGAIEQGVLAPEDFAPILVRLAETVESSLEGDGGPLSWRTLLSGDAVDPMERRRFFVIQPANGPDAAAAEAPPRRRALDAIEAAVGETLATVEPGEATVRLTGAPVLARAELATVREGAAISGVLSFVAVAAILVIGLGSVRSVAAVLLTLVIGLAWTLGYTTLVLGRLNLISVSFVVLFVGLAVDFGIHFVLRWREVRLRVRSPIRTLGTTARFVAWALTLSAIGAAFGFFSFVPTDYTGLAELGIIAGGSMFVALIAFLTVLPALVRLLPARYGMSRAQFRKRMREPRLLTWLARQSRLAVVGAIAALAVAAVALATRIEFDANPLNLQNPETEAAVTLAQLKADLRTTPDTISVVAPSLERAEELARRLAALDAVGQTLTLNDFVPGNQDDKYFLIDSMAFSLLPAFIEPEAPAEADDDAARAESLARLVDRLAAVEAGETTIEDPAFLEAAGRLAGALRGLQAAAEADSAVLTVAEVDLLGTLPPLLDRLETLLSPDPAPIGLEDLPGQLRDRWVAADGGARVEARPAARLDDAATLHRFSEAVRAVAPTAAGGPVSIAGGADVVTRAFVTATLLTTALVVALLFAVRIGWHCMAMILVPLGLAASLTLAAAVLLGQPLNFANIIALPLVFGLGVSSSIHLVMRWDLAGRDLAVLNTSTPQAVLLSALTTGASFGTLALSPHPGTASMGVLLTAALAMVLFCTLVILPALLSLASKQRPGSRAAAA